MHRRWQTRDRDQVDGRLPRLLTLGEVIEKTQMSRSTIYALMGKGLFPRPIRVGARSVRWIEAEIVEFIKNRPRGGSDTSQR